LRASSEEARARAEATFKKKERQAVEGAKARAEYEARAMAIRERTARLRALRLAKQAETPKMPARPAGAQRGAGR